ncbi:hypothetical protein PRK78_004073 [Emydomyces testavorans]|uniref:Uncharacterized protein n=1 Tax=Emydomyces testavorans TaxID=2070801 RepID=A0AAF0DHE1_9EURO|nr:hypothetical protein PRK78_004073 [Emydomyces testavorans]
MEPVVEVLVHISAPSGAGDDVNHRALADACLNFEAGTRIRIYPNENDELDRNEELNVLNQISCNSHHATSSRTSTNAGYTFEDSVLYDVLDAQKEQPSAVSDGGECYTTEMIITPTKLSDTDSFETLPETVPDSQLSFSPTWNPHRNSELDVESTTGEISNLEPLACTKQDAGGATIPNANLTESESFRTLPESVLDSQPSFRSTGDVERNGSPDMGPIKAVQIDSRLSSSQLVSPPKRIRLSITEKRVALVVRESNLSSDLTEVVSSDPIDLSCLPELPAEIHAPLPKISDRTQFSTHITPSLEMLSEQLISQFKPTYQARQLGILERGYWYLRIPIDMNKQDIPSDKRDERAIAKATKNKRHYNPGPWTLDCFLQFWNYLLEFIGQHGRAGWGVWCVCDSAGDQPATESIRQLDVRIYAWGETASHIYLLLFLASDKRIKGVPNVEWRDGKGEVVLRME